MTAFLLALVASSTVSCGEVDYRCPADLTFVFGELPAIQDVKTLGCGFARESVQWRCRAESTEAEAVNIRRANDALTRRLSERNAELDEAKRGHWWSGAKVLALGIGAGLGGAGGAALPFERPGERAAAGALGVALGTALSLGFVLALE